MFNPIKTNIMIRFLDLIFPDDKFRQVLQNVDDGVSSGGGSYSLIVILGTIIAVLVGLGFLVLVLISFRRCSE